LLAIFISCFDLPSVQAQELSVVVPVLYSRPDSRPSHFNWEFESSGGGDVQIGQFACGSYWVAPANGDTGVKVLSLTGKTDDSNWHDYISCDADPITENHGLMGTKTPLAADSIADGNPAGPVYGSYDASENIIPNLPFTYSPGSGSCVSLVAALQRHEAETSKNGTKGILGEAVDAYCIVTILPSVPANNGSDMIRPNITGTTKEFLTWDDFDLSRLPSYSYLSGKTTQGWLDTQTRWRSSTEIFGMNTEISTNTWKYFSEGGRAFRAHNLISDYGSGVSRTFNDDVFTLFSNANTLAEKKVGLAAMLAYGLDIYHARYDYGTADRKAWSSGAGQWQGQFMPVVLLSALLEDDSKADELRKIAISNHGDEIADLGPVELRQISRGVTGVLLWGDGPPYHRNGNTLTDMEWRHWANMTEAHCFDSAIGGTCNIAAGKKTSGDPYGYIDGPAEKPGTNYMAVSFGSVRALAAAMILMPEIRSVINTDDPIEYVDRALRHGLWTYPDPVATIADDDQGCLPYYTYVSGCDDWGVTWGPDPSDVRFAIEDGTGRFPSMDGNALVPTSSYESSAAKNNWATIIALYDGDTYEDNAVALGVVVSPEIIFDFASDKAHIRSATPDAEIRYTLDGSNPTTSSILYTAPVSVSDETEVRAKAYLTGKTASAVRIRVFNGTGSSDTTAPSVPTGLTSSNVTSLSVDLDWTASTDNVAVAGYNIYTNGTYSGNLSGTSVTVGPLSPSTSYTFTVSAYDTSNNESTQSSGVSITTTSGSSSWSVDIEAHTDDQEIWDTGGAKYVGQSNMRIGGSGSNVDANGVFPFELPELDAGETITAASFSIKLESISGSPSGSIDIHGLDYRTTSAVSASTDYYDGSFTGDSSATPIDDAFATLSSSTGTILVTDSTGESNLADYLNAQYTAGAEGGDFVFLRLNPSDPNVGNYLYWVFSSANASTSGDRPTLSIEVTDNSDTEDPTVPTGVSLDAITSTTATLSWNASMDNVGVTGYKVYTDGSNPVSVTATNTTITGLTVGVDYTFTVSAVDAASNESLESSDVDLIRVTGVNVVPSTLGLITGGTGFVYDTVSPSNAFDLNVNWSSSNTSVATVDSTGLVTAIAVGSATITGTTVDGGYTDTCAVTVSAPSVRYVDVEGHTDDQEIYDTGGSKYVGQANMRIGGSGSNVDACGVFPFELPVLVGDETITSATFTIKLESLSGSPSGSIDLHGLDYRTTSAVSASGDYYDGSFSGDSAATPIDGAFATLSSSTGTILVTDSTGESNLVDYLNAQYTAGAEGGDYVFLRLNPSDPNVANYQYWVFSSANASTAADRPQLSIEITEGN